ncbi:MAG: hypothetical protein HOP13_12325 [Alphaproteobacteria bacterium]|nr:hypothetical protein [Alphaproteobacteria bacterium]
MLDHCRMRAACIGKGGAGSVTKASSGDIEEVFSRATATAQGLVANEIGEAVIPAADSPEPSMLEVLRNQGVCRKASELIQASTAAPAVAQAVASTVPAALAPSTGAVSPQDLVTGAVQSALNAPSVAAPRDGEVTQTAAPATREAAAPQFTGSAFGFGGGEGGPVLQEAPPEEPKQR